MPTPKFPIDEEEIYVLPKVFVPVKMFESERSVDEAKVQVEVENEYKRPDELTATPPEERAVSVKLLAVSEEVAVSVPTVRFPIVEDDCKVFMNANGEVEAEYVIPLIEL